MLSILTTYLTQNNSILRKLFNISAFFCMRNGYRSITNFHIADAKILTYLYIIIKLITNQKASNKVPPK